MSIYVHRSNRTEELVEALARVVGRPLADPIRRECIVVQGRGMERWLSMELASRIGVWANPDFPFPRRIIDRTMEALLGPASPRTAAFEPETLLWAVARRLAHLPAGGVFDEVRHYLREDESGRRCAELAERIARTFDDYLVFRPEMLDRWERRAEGDWQAALWRDLVGDFGPAHVAARARRAIDVLQSDADITASLPERISVFGVSTVAPLYLHFFAALSTRIDVHLFLLSPSELYWADIRGRRQQLRDALSSDVPWPELDTRLALEEGHPLLASLGRVGRDFQGLLESVVDNYEAEEMFREPAGSRMLDVVQDDILRLQAPVASGADPRLVASDDTSIEVHSCHGPMREVEVLHDRILALLDEDPDLEPRDIVVMTPSIESYAPLIEAVFSPLDRGRRLLPYRIADRGARAANEVFDAFEKVVALLGSRMGAADVFDLLRVDLVRRRFGLPEEDLERLRDWIDRAGVRWGTDGAHRALFGQPDTDLHTWRFGLDRLLLGYAIGGGERELFCDVLPTDQVEGSEAQSLGRLADLCQRLFEYAEMLREPRPIKTWRADLARLLAAFVFEDRQTAYQHQVVRETLREIEARAETARFEEAVAAEPVVAQLEREIELREPAHGFLSGGLTFCELVPMRSIPFRVVCLLGMNQDAFPRGRRSLDFDLMAAEPRRGDRSARDDDRYLFLEALLSARDRMMVFYVGQSVRDNTRVPPSAVVSELLDTLELSFRREQGESDVVIRHPLQPFSPRYFDASREPRLFSYSGLHCDAARHLAQGGSEERRFVTAPLPERDVDSVDVDELARFFENPTRAFLQKRLGIYLGRDSTALESREPVDLDHLGRWKLGDFLVQRMLDDEELDWRAQATRSGALPVGALGEQVMAEVERDAQHIAEVAKQGREGGRLPTFEVSLEIDGVRIGGTLRDLFRDSQQRVQYSKLGRRQEIGMWVRHLVLNCIDAGALPRTTVIVGRPQGKRGFAVGFRPVDQAHAFLSELIGLYRAGQQRPLPLFEGSSWVYAAEVERTGSREEALGKAERKFTKSAAGAAIADSDDDYVAQVYGDRPPFGAASPAVNGDPDALAFETVSLMVLGPMLEHRVEQQ